MTRRSDGAVAAVVAHVAGVGRGPAAARATCRWAQRRPELAGFGSPAEVASACRNARGAEQDRLVSALLAVAAGDEWAQLTVLAGLAARLSWVVSQWVRAGLAAVEVADMEAELVAACWQVIAASSKRPPPCRPGLALVDRARDQVRAGRRRWRRREDRETALPEQLPAAAGTEGRPVLEVLAGEVTGAVAGGRLGVRAARAVYLTRVAGYSTVEAGAVLGCGPGVLRMMRCRAEWLLAV